MAHRRETPRHLDEEDDADRAENDRPDELIAERRAGLRRGRQRADLEEAADARDDAERYLQQLVHRGGGREAAGAAKFEAAVAASPRARSAPARSPADTAPSARSSAAPLWCIGASVTERCAAAPVSDAENSAAAATSFSRIALTVRRAYSAGASFASHAASAICAVAVAAAADLSWRWLRSEPDRAQAVRRSAPAIVTAARTNTGTSGNATARCLTLALTGSNAIRARMRSLD